MNQYDAPTSFITEISFFRLKIVICRAFKIINAPPMTNVIISQNTICSPKSETFKRFFETLVMMLLFPEFSLVVTLERYVLYFSWDKNFSISA